MANSIDTIIQNATIRANTLANSAWESLSNASTIASNFERITWPKHSFIQKAEEAINDTTAPEFSDTYVQPVNQALKPELSSIFIPDLPSYPNSI